VERRRFLLTSLASAVAVPFADAAQQAVPRSRVGVLMNLYPPDAPPPLAFRQELRGLGYIEGQSLVIDWR
jgi:hypothetical protein